MDFCLIIFWKGRVPFSRKPLIILTALLLFHEVITKIFVWSKRRRNYYITFYNVRKGLYFDSILCTSSTLILQPIFKTTSLCTLTLGWLCHKRWNTSQALLVPKPENLYVTSKLCRFVNRALMSLGVSHKKAQTFYIKRPQVKHSRC